MDTPVSPDRDQERIFVKSLERVQGDERDAIILTIGYGKSSDGRMLYRFGPVNNRRASGASTWPSPGPARA